MRQPRPAALALLSSAVAAAAAPPDGTTASGCSFEMPNGEDDRVQEFRRIWGKWPPKMTLPDRQPMRETQAWKEYHAKKELGLMQVDDHTARWEFWLEQAQIRTLQNFTETGWGIGRMPKDLHKKVKHHFRSRLPDLPSLSNHSVPLYTTGDQVQVILPGDMRAAITNAVKLEVAKWASRDQADLQSTSTYGIRNYWRGSTLKTHVDRVETHILSAVYCVDARYPEGAERWLMETDPDLTGEHVSVDIKPGMLFFYESAKLVHGRPTVLQGDYSAHVFIHFRPWGWAFQNIDRVYGVPPGYAGRELDDAGDGRGAEL